ncbi:MAG: hypothetical protein AB1698_03400 [Pseudomonadota bacterium]
MATKPRRASARSLINSFPDPHQHLRRRTRRPEKTITQMAAEEVFDLISALADHFQPVALVPGGTAFLATLPEHLIDRLAALGAVLDDREPDAGEEPEGEDSDREQDAGEEPELDHADYGIADRDALDLFSDEREALDHFWDSRDRNRPVIHAMAARLKARKCRPMPSLPVREI